MTYTPKDWHDAPNASTPITAEALEDMETRLAAYASAQKLNFDSQVFTSSGTWTKPAGVSDDPGAMVRLICVGSGGGGASGAVVATGTNASGGGGGSGAGYTVWEGLASDVPDSLSVAIPAPGAGAAAVSSSDTAGNWGGWGGKTYFFGDPAPDGGAFIVKAYNGSGGGPGAINASVSGGWHPASTAYDIISNGGSGNNGNVGGDAGWAKPGPSGGGGGGGLTIGTTPQGGGIGGGQNTPELQGGARGVAPGGDGGDGDTVNDGTHIGYGLRGGFGGGGGASSHTGDGGTGGAGGAYGGGGGGGGAARNGNTSGAGGDGGPAVAVASVTWRG